MKQHLAISAIGNDRTGMVHDLTRIVADCGGSISESRMTTLGSEFAMLVLVSGNWHALARLETELKKLAEAGTLTVQLRRTEQRATRSDMLPVPVPRKDDRRRTGAPSGSSRTASVSRSTRGSSVETNAVDDTTRGSPHAARRRSAA